MRADTPRVWVTHYGFGFAWRSGLFFCALVAVMFAAAAVQDGSGSSPPDDPGAIGWIFLGTVYVIWLLFMSMTITIPIALAVAHVLISIPAVASTQQSYLKVFAAISALLPFVSVFFAYRPGITLILCIVLGAGNYAIAFRVARFMTQFPAPGGPLGSIVR